MLPSPRTDVMVGRKLVWYILRSLSLIGYLAPLPKVTDMVRPASCKKKPPEKSPDLDKSLPSALRKVG